MAIVDGYECLFYVLLALPKDGVARDRHARRRSASTGPRWRRRRK